MNWLPSFGGEQSHSVSLLRVEVRQGMVALLPSAGRGTAEAAFGLHLYAGVII